MAYVCRCKPSNMRLRLPFIKTKKQMAKVSKTKSRWTCKGGVFNGHTLVLSTAGTMPFTINGVTGYYDGFMEWVQL